MLWILITEAHNTLRIYREKFDIHRHEDLVKTNPYHTDALKVAIQHTTKESDKTRRQTELTAKTGQDDMAIP